MKVFLSTDNSLIDNIIASLFKKEEKIVDIEKICATELHKRASAERPSLIILSENFELCRKLKSDNATKGIPLISILEGKDEEYHDLSDGQWRTGDDLSGLRDIFFEHLKEKKSILIADDNHLTHQMIKKILGNRQYDYLDAFNGEEAISLAKKHKPDLVITDITMPKSDGFQVCNAIKDNSSTATVPVLIISSHTDYSVIEKGFDAGADDYITKPFKDEYLTEKIEFFLSELSQKRKERVLIVDGSKVIINMLSKGLARQGFTVLCASNGAEALEIIKDEEPDIVLSGLELKEMSGFELCRIIKSKDYCKDIPFIAMTSKITKGSKGVGKKVGVDLYLAKPFSLEKVIVDVERMLAKRRELSAFEKEMVIASITSLAKALDERDAYTRFHSENVSKYSVKIASAFHLPKQEIETIRIAALLHDIGKIGIRDDVLLKKGKLTDEEYDLIKNHSKKGASILEPIVSLRNISKLILHHHERFDGKGYPDGIKGEEIPFGSKIIAVADTYDALTSDRPYRKSMGKEKAISILKENSATQLCPLCVERFLTVLDEEIL